MNSAQRSLDGFQPHRPAPYRAVASLAALLAVGFAGAALAQSPPPEPTPTYAPPTVGPATDRALDPPTGYSQHDAQADATAKARQEDRNYAAAAERWSAANCVLQKQDQSAGGAIIGGVLGAVIGSNLAGRGSRGAGAVVGGAVGAAAGGAIAANAGPNCPPGFTVRAGATRFSGPPFALDDAPSWYMPWLWYDGRWMYRPYPYHRYWHDHPEYRQLAH